MFDGSKSVLERSSIGRSSGQFFCVSEYGCFPPAVWEGLRLTEYGCGIRLPTSVRPRRALSEAPGRPHQNVDLGLPMTS